MRSHLSQDAGPLQAAPERVPTWEEVAAEHGRFVYSLAYRLTAAPPTQRQRVGHLVNWVKRQLP
jgi:hypothetical protein